MGTVYRARHLQVPGEYALKTIPLDSDSDAVLRTRRESEAMSALAGHPNVVSVHGLFEEQGLLCLVLELCPGGDLSQRIAKGALGEAEATELVSALAEGLGAAHAAGILHRDLKPANVLFDAEGTPKLTDFGIARVADRQSLTQTGALMGTPAYMSPEQAQGLRADARSDVYGLGAILYEALSGAPPFGPGTVLGILQEVVNAPPPPLPQSVSAKTAALCMRALAKDPQQRPQSAEDFERALSAGEDNGLLQGALRGLALVLALLIVALLTLLTQRSFARAPEAASPTPPAHSSPHVTPGPDPRSTLALPSPTPLAPQRPARAYWELEPIEWPEQPGEREPDPRVLRHLSRVLARHPTLAPKAWRARGLRTHAVDSETSNIPLQHEVQPLSHYLARSLQALEETPTNSMALAAVAKGVQSPKLVEAMSLFGHPRLGEWVLFRVTASGSDRSLKRLGGTYLPLLGSEGGVVQQATELVRARWTDPAACARPEAIAAWQRLQEVANERLAVEQRALLSTATDARGVRGVLSEPDRAFLNRALAELSTRSWDLLLLVEAATREKPQGLRIRGPGQHWIQEDLFVESKKAVTGSSGALRDVAMRITEGTAGVGRDPVVGRLLLQLVVSVDRSTSPHALYNLGHGSTADTFIKLGDRPYEDRELACLVLSGAHKRTQTALKLLAKHHPDRAIPTPAEALLVYLEHQARDLDAAGLLGGPPRAYGSPPGLPERSPWSPGEDPDDQLLTAYFRAWFPHSLVLRVVGREAARLPPQRTEARREFADSLRGRDPDAPTHLLRAALEGDRLAARRFVEVLPFLPVTDRILNLRLAIAVAFFGQPRVLENIQPTLAELALRHPSWSARLKEVDRAVERIYWEGKEHIEAVREKYLNTDAGPDLPEAWRTLRAFDEFLSRAPVLTRLSEWDAAPFLPGDPKSRLQTGLERLALRYAALAEEIRAAKADPTGQVHVELQEVLSGSPLALVYLTTRWGKEGRLELGRAALQLALEALPRKEWRRFALPARSLYLPGLSETLTRISQEPVPAPRDWQAFHLERERAFHGAGLPTLVDLDAWGLPR